MWSYVIQNIPSLVLIAMGVGSKLLGLPDIYVGGMIDCGLLIFRLNAGVRISAPDATVNVKTTTP